MHSAGTVQLVVYASAARTAAPSSIPVFTTYGDFVGAQFYIKVTGLTGAPSVTFDIEGLDAASGDWYSILTSAAVNANPTTRRLTIHPAMTASANVAINDFLPYQWRVKPTHSNSDSITFSVGANLLP